jgi:hypothetical protein
MDVELYKHLCIRAAPQPDGCWNWKAKPKPNGYGYLTYRGVKHYAHRLMWRALHGGELTAKDVVMHVCDNRRCVNPDHLRLGTHQDNSRDMVRKGRGSTQRLTLTQIAEIKLLLKIREALAPKHIAARYGVSRSAIGHIATGNTWEGA